MQSIETGKVLAGQVAVITGAARGIGRAVAERLGQLGAHAVLIARDRAKLDDVLTNIEKAGGSATAYPADLRDASSIDQLASEIAERWGRCDILVNNAGVGRFHKPLHEMTIEDWDQTFDTNLRAVFLMIRAVAPGMIEAKAGHIINISSLGGRNPLPNGAAYSASKAGLNGLSYSVAEELRPFGIRVSVIAPGSVNTGFGGSDGTDAAKAARKIQPEDVAHVVEMLVRQAPQSFVSEVLLRPTSKP